MGRGRAESTVRGRKARAWRERVGLTPQDLADHTGYSREAVYQFERGKRADGSDHSEWAWQRFQLCCGAIETQMKTGKVFEW